MSPARTHFNGSEPIIVVGAGIVGLCVAWHLRRRGAHVTLIDREEPARSCSFGNAGALSSGSLAPLAMPGVLKSAPSMLMDPESPIHIPFHYWLKVAPWLLRFSLSARKKEVTRIAQAMSFLVSDAVELHMEMLKQAGRSDLIRTNGQLYLYRTAAQMRGDSASWRLRCDYGVRTETVDRGQLLELEPQIGPAYQMGIFTPDQAMSLDPYGHALALAEDFVRQGGQILKDDVRALGVEGHRVSSVIAAGGTYPATAVVLCAGAWSARLLDDLGYRIPLESQRGYHARVANADAGISRPIVLSDRRVFVTPLQDGVRAAGTVEFGGLDRLPTSRRAELLFKHFREAFPDIDQPLTMETWMGHRPCMPDTIPVLGDSVRHAGLWFAFGHGHLGLTTAPRSGQLIADAMMGARPSRDLQPYSIHRFEKAIDHILPKMPTPQGPD